MWVLLFLALLSIITVPTSVGVQLLLSLGGIFIIVALKPFSNLRAPRVILLSVASTIVLRYWFWRLFETLPSTEDPLSYAAAILLFSVETYAIGVFFLGAFLMADPVDRGYPKPLRLSQLPSVDILVPTLNEPVEMLGITLAAARNIDYPEHLVRVVLCDDGGTDARCNDDDPVKAYAARERRRQLQALCTELGVTYMTRPENIMAKAGNLNEALSKLHGEFVLILDADHAPTTDFLARTIGFLVEDPKLFLVQTPHFFLNPDPVARNLRLSENCPPENEMFYNAIQAGLDKWDGTFFCGSAAVLRRAALDEVGGISGDTITEDAETSLKIQARGWRSLYVNRAMIAGLQPETFASFLQQRGRWATGMVQLLMLKNPIFISGLNVWQRLCYFNSTSYWLFPIVRLILLVAPLAYLFFGLELLVTTASEAAVYMAGYMAAAYLVQNALFNTTRWPFISEIYEIAQSPYLIRGVLGAMVKPRGASFKVTSKNEVVDVDRFSEVAFPLIALFVLMLAGLAAAAWRYANFPGDREVIYVVGAWTLFNAILVGAAAGAVVDRRQRRGAPRFKLSQPVSVSSVGYDIPEEVNGKLTDISRIGARLQVTRPQGISHSGALPQGTQVQIVPAATALGDASGPILATVTRSAGEGGMSGIGVQFEETQTAGGYRSLAAVLNGRSDRWESIRVAQAGKIRLIPGIAYALWLSISGMSHLLRPAFTGKKPPSRAPDREDFPIEAWTTHPPVQEAALRGEPEEEATFGVLPARRSVS